MRCEDFVTFVTNPFSLEEIKCYRLQLSSAVTPSVPPTASVSGSGSRDLLPRLLPTYLCVCAKSLSHVQLHVTPWTVACQAPLSMGILQPRYWSGLPCPPPGDLPDPGIELTSLLSPALASGFFTACATWEAPIFMMTVNLQYCFVCAIYVACM